MIYCILGSMRRLFIAAPLPENILNICLQAQKDLNILYGNKIRLTPKNQLHITLAFLGEVDDNDIQNIDKSITGMRGWGNVVVELSHLNAFPHPSATRIIAIDLIDKPGQTLTALALNLRSLLRSEKIRYDHKPWRSHITIARARQTVFLKKINLINDEFEINDILLMESRLSGLGPTYFILNKYELIP